MVEELKSLKNDVTALKRQTNESEQQHINEIQVVSDKKKELEIKFGAFQESNNKQKADLLVQIGKLKRMVTGQQKDLLTQEEQIQKYTKQIADLLEERKMALQRANDDKKVIENLENHKTRMTADFEAMKSTLEKYRSQLPRQRDSSHDALI